MRSKFLRLIVLLSMFSVTGCTAFGMVTDAVLWLPRKVGHGIGSAWDATAGKLFETPEKNNKWQEELELGPRRKPSSNPGTQGWNNGEGEDVMPSAKSSQMPYGAGMMPPSGSGSSMPKGVVIPYPSNMGSGGMPSYGGQGGGMDDYMGGGGASDPYGAMDPSGGMGKGGFPMPSPYGGASGAAPYESPNHSLVRKFEPVAAEFSMDKNGQVLESKSTPTDLENVMQPHQKNKDNMFPLEEYRPKSDLSVTAMADKYPKVGEVPDHPEINREEMNSKVDSLIKDLDNANKRNAIMQFEDKKNPPAGVKKEETKPKQENHPEDSSNIKNESEDFDSAAMGMADAGNEDNRALKGSREEQEKELQKKMERIELSKRDIKKADDAVLGTEKSESKKGFFNRSKKEESDSEEAFRSALNENKNFSQQPQKTKVVMEKAANEITTRRPVNNLAEIPEESNIPVPAQIIGKTSTNYESEVPPPPNVVLPKVSDDGVVTIYNKNSDIYTGVLPKSRYAGRRNASE